MLAHAVLLSQVRRDALRCSAGQMRSDALGCSSGAEAGSYLRLIDFVYHKTLGVRVLRRCSSLSPAVLE